jgi:glycosyltransferase involved in cell wall biosynthesis
MKIIFISEHYEPILGGTTTYVKSICEQMSNLGQSVELIAPQNTTIGKLDIVEINLNWRIHYIGLGCSLTSIPRNLRFKFVENVNIYLHQVVNEIKPDIIHVLFGMFLLEGLKIEEFSIPCCVTIHNIPPRECGTSWLGDSPWRYVGDILRKKVVGWINHRRLLIHKYDTYITVSSHTKQILSAILPNKKIVEIQLGAKAPKPISPDYSQLVIDQKCQILTVGGFVPHKGYHISLKVASQLLDNKFQFLWTIIGASRNQRYYKYLQDKIVELGLNEVVNLRLNITEQELRLAYYNSHIYVQTSLEEGFCLATLDAAFYGIPIIGTPQGAIPEIIKQARGVLTESYSPSIAHAITHTWNLIPEYVYTEDTLIAIRQKYSWRRVADEMIETYKVLTSNAT